MIEREIFFVCLGVCVVTFVFYTIQDLRYFVSDWQKLLETDSKAERAGVLAENIARARQSRVDRAQMKKNIQEVIKKPEWENLTK